MTPGQPSLDCLGKGKLAENQMQAIIARIKKDGLLQQDPPDCEGRGIVIGGGGKYLKHAWAVAKHCRNLGYQGPIQVWHLGPEEMPDSALPRFSAIETEPVDALHMRCAKPSRMLGGWELGVYSTMYCPWRHVMWLDADSHPVINPDEIFNHRDIRTHGSLFCSDISKHHKSTWGYTYCGILPGKKEWESGQFVVDKVRAWMGLRWAFWLNEHSEVWYRLFMGDKGSLEAGIRMSGVPHLFSEDSRWNPNHGIDQYWGGVQWWKHWMRSKRGESLLPPEIQEAFDEWDSSPTVSSRLSVPVAVA